MSVNGILFLKDLNGGQVVAPLNYPSRLFVVTLPPTLVSVGLDELHVQLIEYGGMQILDLYFAPSSIAGSLPFIEKGEIDASGNYVPS